MNVTGPAARAVFTGRNETTAGLHNRQRLLVFRGLTRGSPHAGSDDVGVAGLLAAAVAFAAATDAAGNASRVNGSNRLVVKRASREDDRDD